MSTILIAGGATGIGLAAMGAFRRNGDNVLLADINHEAAESATAEELPGRAEAFGCDLGTESGPGAAVDATISAFGELDVVFGNAGVVINKPVEDLTVEDWDRTMHVNLRAAFLLAKAAVPYLIKSPTGRLIFTSSLPLQLPTEEIVGTRRTPHRRRHYLV